MEASAVRERANELPREPGIYQFLATDAGESKERRSGQKSDVTAVTDADPGGTVLYVGKAVDLRDRVRSYADPRSERVERMVERADWIDVAVTDTETQALLLEANLIKRHAPRYNVRLKDDKSYPLVQLTDHSAPRIEITRDPDPGATVFGPYTDKGRVETVVKALRETYGLRGCSDHKYQHRERPCLDYEMGLCTAPCTGEIAPADYHEDVESVRRFFGGETGVLTDPLRREMESAAQNQEFERAANLRDRLESVQAFHSGAGAAVASGDGRPNAAADSGERVGRTVDVLGVAVEGDAATVARLHSEDGQLVDRSRHRLDVPEGDRNHARGPAVAAVLSAFVSQYYAERTLPDALLVPERLDDAELLAWLDDEEVAVRVPGAGREARLLDLALKNARRGPGRADGDELDALAAALSIPRPDRIEGFDVSHAQGRAAVGSNVLFVEGSADTSGYRRKRLSDENDDYANIRDLVRWRAERALDGRDDRPDPDLLLVDGGAGQLRAAQTALETTGWEVPVIALAKEDERVVTPEGVHDWDHDTPHLHLLQRVRDEAHRFAVQYHQQVRDRVETALDGVPGVGPELRRRLLRRFGSVDGVRTASIEELQSVDGVGRSTAETIERHL